MKKIAIAALTEQGRLLAHKINQQGQTDYPIFLPAKLCQTEQSYQKASFKASLQDLFKHYEGLICIMATGIVVRALAEVLQDKRVDPTVVVLDERGRNVISLLSGHIGGGNQLTRDLAAILQANPVITTATDTQNVTALDSLAQQVKGWYADFKENTKKVNGLLAAHEKVAIFQEQPLVTDVRGLTPIFDLEKVSSEFAAVLVVSNRQLTLPPENYIQIVPRVFVLGIGARKNIEFAVVQASFLSFCANVGVHPRSIKQLASIDVKGNEPALVELAAWLEVPFITYSKAELLSVAGKYPESEFVKATVGVGNVALSAADLASGGQVVTPRFAKAGVTLALGRE